MLQYCCWERTERASRHCCGVIAGLISPSEGTLAVLGGTPRSERDRLAFMSHAPMLYDELTGIENLRYFASLYGIDGSQRRAGAARCWA